MAKFKRLVYLPGIPKKHKTWLLWTKEGEASVLRPYSADLEIEDIKEFSTSHINDLLKSEEAFLEKTSCNVPYTDDPFWQEEINLRNIESGFVDDNTETRLLDEFKRRFESVAGADSSSNSVGNLFREWKTSFGCIKKKDQFNHWDNDDCSHKIGTDTGMGWQSRLLEFCRADNSIQFVEAQKELDFTFVAMELSFGISSKNNQFKGRSGTDYIKPDGLGIRRDGCFTVFEVKGPKDDATLIAPMLQAVCGAMAVYARREMVTHLASKPEYLAIRPAFDHPSIPPDKPSLGAHILTANWGRGRNGLSIEQRWENESVSKVGSQILDAFPELKYIAFSFLEEDDVEEFGRRRLKIQKLIQR